VVRENKNLLAVVAVVTGEGSWRGTGRMAGEGLAGKN
jgi:hypothetical protein